jgi:hypothetical protein
MLSQRQSRWIMQPRDYIMSQNKILWRRSRLARWQIYPNSLQWNNDWHGNTQAKVKLSLCLINQAPCHGDVLRSGVVAPTFLTSATDTDHFYAPAALSPRKEPTYPFGRRLGGLQSRSERYVVVKSLLSLPGIEPQTSTHSPSLYRLQENTSLWHKLFPDPFYFTINSTWTALELIQFIYAEKSICYRAIVPPKISNLYLSKAITSVFDVKYRLSGIGASQRKYRHRGLLPVLRLELWLVFPTRRALPKLLMLIAMGI